MKAAVAKSRQARSGASPARLSAVDGWLVERFASYGRAFVLAGLFSTPLAIHRGAAGPYGTPKLTVLWLAGLGAVACWAVWSLATGARLPRFRIGYAAVAFVGAAGLATAFSLSPKLSLIGQYQRYGGLVPLVLYVAIMLAIVALHWQRPERLRAILWAIGASSTIVAGSVLLQQAGIDRTLWAGPVPGTLFDYPYGTVGHSNFAGAHLGMALPCLWYLLVTAGHRLARSALGAVVGLNVVALWYTQSRGGMLAGLIGLAAMTLAIRERLGFRAKVALAAGATVIIAVAALVVVLDPRADTTDRRLAGAAALRTKTLEFRLSYWGAATRIFLDHPLVGTGLDTFYASYPRYQAIADGADPIEQLRVDKPHNVILEHASDSGSLGLLTYLAVIGLAMRYGVRRCRQIGGHERLLLASCLGLLAAYLAQGFFSIDQPSLEVTGWIAVGCIAALADPVLVKTRQATTPSGVTRAKDALTPNATPCPGPTGHHRLSRGGRWLGYTFVLAAVVSLSLVGLRLLRADIALEAGRSGDAIALDPLNATYRLRAGTEAELAGRASPDASQQRRRFSDARKRYLQALHLQPGEVNTMVRLARLETVWAQALDPGRFVQAEAWWRRAMTHDPTDQVLRQSFQEELPVAERRTAARLEAEAQVRPLHVPTRIDLAQTYVALGEDDKARDALEEALALDPANVEAKKLLAILRP